MSSQLNVDASRIESLCRRWAVRELSLFGSVIREDFGPSSDVDVLVSFDSGACWSLLDLVHLREELETLFGRRVDLVEKEAVRNPYRRRTNPGTARSCMRPEERDVAYLWDMREAARTALDLVAGIDLEVFLADRRTQLAVERALGLVGEAARRVSASLRDAHPLLP